MNDKTLDSVLGFAIGDALGVPAEFKSRSQLKANPVEDMTGYGTHGQPKGTWSDDTSMTLATMDSIVEYKEINYDDIMGKFFEWVLLSEYTGSGEVFDIGVTTNNALKNYRDGKSPLECGEKDIRSNGNGSLMRILPVVLYCYYNNIPENEEVEIINNVSSLTHAHEISRLGCKIYSDYVKELLNGNDKETAYSNLIKNDYSKYYSKDSISYYNRILDGNIGKLKEDDIKSSGFVVSTLEASIWSLLQTENYKDAVLKAVNLGDDTDTVAAITGSLAGTLYGSENIPQKWVNDLLRKDYLVELCNSFDNVLKKNGMNR